MTSTDLSDLAPQSTISIRDLLLKILSTRTGAVSFMEIDGVISANYVRANGGSVGSKLIANTLSALIKEGALSVKTVNLADGAGRTGYYTLIKPASALPKKACKVDIKKNLSEVSRALNSIKPTYTPKQEVCHGTWH